MHRILIDGRFIGVGESISRYTLEIVGGILKLDKSNHYTLLVRPEGEKIAKQFFKTTNNKLQISDKSQKTNSDIENWNLKIDNFQLKVLDIPHYSLAEQTKLLTYLNREKFDLVHFTQFNHPVLYRGKFVITIHDMTLFEDLYRKNIVKNIGMKKVMKSAVKNSQKIITISKTSKRKIIKKYHIDPKKIEVVYAGVDEKYSTKINNIKSKIKQFRKKYNISGDYILYAGMWKKHKNIIRMLKAFERLINFQLSDICKENKIHSTGQSVNKSANLLQLVIVGRVDKGEPAVIKEVESINNRNTNYESGVKNKNHNIKYTIPNTNVEGDRNQEKINPVIITGFIEEEELPIAYAGALAYCIPSLSEGFGLPPIEAMACGTPVISSKISAMPEILGDSALYFDPFNINSIAGAMEKVVADGNLREELYQKGLIRASKYCWQKSAKETLRIYKSAF